MPVEYKEQMQKDRKYSEYICLVLGNVLVKGMFSYALLKSLRI